MMARKIIVVSLFFILLTSLTGCATTNNKQKELEIQGLRNQILVLETQLQTNNEEISNLRDALSRTIEEKSWLEKETTRKRSVQEVKSRPTIKQIQIALEKAGYNPGVIDGRMGRQTREAIREFQKANNLAVDGKAGRQTWNLLKEYLYKKIK